MARGWHAVTFHAPIPLGGHFSGRVCGAVLVQAVGIRDLAQIFYFWRARDRKTERLCYTARDHQGRELAAYGTTALRPFGTAWSKSPSAAADRVRGASRVPRDLSNEMLDALMRRIDAATAALPGRPDAALRELRLARALLDAARQVKDTPAAGWDPRLTLREREVLGLLASGSRNKEIALRLGLRERTVKFHVANLLRKLDAQSRTEALRRALEFGLVESGGLSLAK